MINTKRCKEFLPDSFHFHTNSTTFQSFDLHFQRLDSRVLLGDFVVLLLNDDQKLLRLPHVFGLLYRQIVVFRLDDLADQLDGALAPIQLGEKLILSVGIEGDSGYDWHLALLVDDIGQRRDARWIFKVLVDANILAQRDLLQSVQPGE